MGDNFPDSSPTEVEGEAREGDPFSLVFRLQPLHEGLAEDVPGPRLAVVLAGGELLTVGQHDLKGQEVAAPADHVAVAFLYSKASITININSRQDCGVGYYLDHLDVVLCGIQEDFLLPIVGQGRGGLGLGARG